MKKPETDTSETKANSGKEAKKDPVAGTAVESRPVAEGKTEKAGAAAVQPPAESKLVGSGAGPDAARPKAAGTPAPAGESAARSAATMPAPEKTASAGTEPSKPGKSEPAKAETRIVEVRKAGFMPTFLGGLVAAGLGAGAAYWAIPRLPAAWQPDIAAVPADVQADVAQAAVADAVRAEFQAQSDALTQRAAEAGADAARQALADAPPPPTATGDVAALQAQGDKLAALEKAVADIAARPAIAPVISGADGDRLQPVLDELTSRLAAQQQRIDELASRPASDPAVSADIQNFAAQAEALQAQVAAAADAAQQRIAAAETQAAALQETADSANRRARITMAASALQAAIEAGGSRDQALADLQASGAEVPAVLTGDIPTLEQLRAAFPAAARAGLAAALKGRADNGGAMGVIGDFLRVQTGARSVEPREGDDPDAILSRADAAIKAGDIRGALTEIGALPQPGQDAMSGWTGQAQLWIDANAALAALAAGSM